MSLHNSDELYSITVTNSRCSAEHINEYKQAINKYLLEKGVTDFSKYNISFKKDKLTFNKWEYEGSIPQPNESNLTLIPIVKDNYIPPKIYNFHVVIGAPVQPHYVSHYFTIHNLSIPGMIPNTESNCFIQVTACINTDETYEQIFTSIRNFKCQDNKLRLELMSVRATNEVWHDKKISAFVTVYYKPTQNQKVYYRIPA